MQPREYRTSVAWSIFSGAGGVILLAGGLALFINGITSAQLDAGALIIGIAVTVLGSFFLANGLRPGSVTADDTGLHVRGLFGTRHIPWDGVQAFRVKPLSGKSGPSVQALLRTNEVISLPDLADTGTAARRIADGLTEALREHARSPAPPPGDGQATTTARSE